MSVKLLLYEKVHIYCSAVHFLELAAEQLANKCFLNRICMSISDKALEDTDLRVCTSQELLANSSNWLNGSTYCILSILLTNPFHVLIVGTMESLALPTDRWLLSASKRQDKSSIYILSAAAQAFKNACKSTCLLRVFVISDPKFRPRADGIVT